MLLAHSREFHNDVRSTEKVGIRNAPMSRFGGTNGSRDTLETFYAQED